MTGPSPNFRRSGVGATFGVKSFMTSPNTFTNACIGFGGALSGADEKPHYLFKIETADGSVLYGDYILAFLEDKKHFNVEIDLFGYVDPEYAGDLNPNRRRHFSAEECAAAEQPIRSFFPLPASSTKRYYTENTFWAGSISVQAGSFRTPTTAINFPTLRRIPSVLSQGKCRGRAKYRCCSKGDR
jgi:hypothetical protein